MRTGRACDSAMREEMGDRGEALDKGRVEEGGACYGRLVSIWQIVYIQDLPRAAFPWRQRV